MIQKTYHDGETVDGDGTLAVVLDDLVFSTRSKVLPVRAKTDRANV